MRYALPKERLFPVDTDAHVKMASQYFDRELDRMTPSQRLVCARGICKAASDMNIDVRSSLAYKYASAHLSPYFHNFMTMRKEATANLYNDDIMALEKLAESAPLDVVMSKVEEFDRHHGLNDWWGTKLPDPAFSVYSPTPDSDSVITSGEKVAGYIVTPESLDSVDFNKLAGVVDNGIILSLQAGEDNGYRVFAALSDAQKDVVAQTLFSEA